MNKMTFALPLALIACMGIVGACSSDDDKGAAGSAGTGGSAAGGTGGSPEQTGSSCVEATDCFPNVTDGGLVGDPICLDRVRDGYCTHLCEKDEDCCAVPGECATSLPQVCSPFESTGQKMCFLSCEETDMQPYDGGAGWEDENEFCQKEASKDFICRSSGGGTENRKICVPGDCGVGAACVTNDDCTGDLDCITDMAGGYCGRADCTSDADCPNGSSCVQMAPDRNDCLRRCTGDSDCSFCRPWEQPTSCTNDVTFVEEGTNARVCLPTLL